MNLFLIILAIIIFSFLPLIFPKLYKLCVVSSVFSVILLYFFLATNFYYPKISLPSKNLYCYNIGYNYYNLLANSLKDKKLYLTENNHEINYRMDCHLPLEMTVKSYNNEQKISATLLDTSFYKGKIYLYFGITPVLLFYLPFNLITGMFLTDNFLVFVLSSFIFLFSLFFVKKFEKNITDIYNVPKNVAIIVIFFIGLCSLLPFILIRTSIYEVAISTAVFLLLCSFIALSFYLKTKKTFFVLLLGFLLSLCVGARPHYVLFISVFFTVICIMNYYRTKNMKYVLNQAIIFLIPCLIIGTGLALYNYFRFDSIFDFGFNYQIKPTPIVVPDKTFINLFNNFIIATKQIFFKIPDIDTETFLSVVNSHGHMSGEDYMSGILWMCPLIIILFFIPNFLQNIYKKNKNLFAVILVMIFVIIISIIVTSFFGMHMRYIFEYFIFMIILSIVMLYFYLCSTKDKLLKNFLHFIFILIFIWSVFVNTALLFSKNNFINGYDNASLVGSYNKKIVKFLF